MEIKNIVLLRHGKTLKIIKKLLIIFTGYIIRSGKTWADTWFLGIKTEKCPLDLWLYQELIFKLKPDLIIETGTRFGGSALFFASMCDLVGKGLVVTIDIDTEMQRPKHPRINYISGSSTNPVVIEQIQSQFRIPTLESILVILDSDHSERMFGKY